MFVEVANASEISQRVEAVYQAIYLLFNEGYHGSQSEQTVREDLCFEAIRLALLLSEHPEGERPRTHALLALLCFHAARLRGRVDEDGGLVQLEIARPFQMGSDLIGKGFTSWTSFDVGDELSEYHLEAASPLCTARRDLIEETDWGGSWTLRQSLPNETFPIVALNRAVALGKALGPEHGLAELRQISDRAELKDYPFYPAAQGEFHLLADGRQRPRSTLNRQYSSPAKSGRQLFRAQVRGLSARRRLNRRVWICASVVNR